MKILYVGCRVRVTSTEHYFGAKIGGIRVPDNDPQNPTGKEGLIVGREAQWWRVLLDGQRYPFLAESWELEPILPNGLLSQIKAEETPYNEAEVV